jgi:hypothetical protein
MPGGPGTGAGLAASIDHGSFGLSLCHQRIGATVHKQLQYDTRGGQGGRKHDVQGFLQA